MRAADGSFFSTALEWPVLPFRIGGQWYAVTLEEVERLCGIRELTESGVPAAALPGQTGGALAVLLRGRRGIFGLPADEAETMLSVPPGERMALPEVLRDAENAWIKSAFYWAERETLCFLLRVDALEDAE